MCDHVIFCHHNCWGRVIYFFLYYHSHFTLCQPWRPSRFYSFLCYHRHFTWTHPWRYSRFFFFVNNPLDMVYGVAFLLRGVDVLLVRSLALVQLSPLTSIDAIHYVCWLIFCMRLLVWCQITPLDLLMLHYGYHLLLKTSNLALASLMIPLNCALLV